jgi:hypothetical protein
MQQLSMNDLAVQSTAIIRGQVVSSYMAQSAQTIYTHYRISVEETWKGPASSTIDVALPGGTANGVRQTFPGVPQLSGGVDYVLYLWTSPQSGLTFPTGFSQGIFTVTGGASALMTSRAPTSELMLDTKGHPVQDPGVSIPLPTMKSQVAAALTKQAGVK